MENRVNTFLETEKIGRLMRRYAVPCVISLLVAALYNIVDQIFIANAPELGSFGNAGNTVVFPLTVIPLAIAVMIGDGCCAFVSLCLGKKDAAGAHRSVGNAVVLCVLAGALVTAVYFAFAEPLLLVFGGGVNERTFACAKEYFLWIAAGLPFYIFGQAMNPIIRADGSPRFAMASTLAGAVLNMILDPLFIFVFGWGMMGAAVATIAGQALTCVLAILYLRRAKAFKLEKSSFTLDAKLMRAFLPLGACSFLAQISLVAAMAAVNNALGQYGAMDAVFGQAQYAQIPMAVLGIVMKGFQIVISVVIGIAAGCIPIVGYNVGARRNDRARALFTRLLACEALVGMAALLIVELLPRQLVALFGAQNESAHYANFAVKAFRVYLCMLPLACVNKSVFIFLQSLGKPWLSSFLSMLREVVLGVGLAMLLPLWFRLDGVLLSMPLADIITFIASAVIIAYTYRALGRGTRAAPGETQAKERP